MHIKTHIAFITLIILVTFLIWKMVSVPQEQKAPLVITAYAIEVVRASYGLECKKQSTGRNSDPYASSEESEGAYRENNILTPLSNRCNGQVRCNVSAVAKDYGLNAFNCSGASLVVEYRCFLLDRLRKKEVKANDSVTIDCSEIK